MTGAAAASYQWYADGEKIEDATDSTLEVTKDMLGKELSVSVTAEDAEVAYSDETAAVAQPDLLITDVDQISANVIDVTFGEDASDFVTKDNLKVEREDGTLVIPVNALEWSLDGTEVRATLAVSLQDDVTYTVSYEESELSFTASVGEVASIVILTTEAEVNVDTDIEFKLLDESGVDVTEAEDVPNRVTIDVTGDTSTYSVSDPTKATLKMDTVGNEAQVTVTYTPEDSDAEPVSTTQKVICVAASETKGAGVFYETAPGKNVNANSGSAKFYNGLSSTSVKVEEGNTSKDIYFYAEDEKGDAINYDLYSVSASNEDVLSVTEDVTEGKYAKFTVTGLNVGSSTIIVKAEKNGVASTYTLPASVYAKGKIKTIKLTTTLPTMTNAIDTRYVGKITAKVYDSNDNEITSDCEINYEASDTTKQGADSLVSVEGIDTILKADGFEFTQLAGADFNKCVYTADGAKGGKYVVNVTASDDTGATVKAQQTITVTALSEDIWAVPANARKSGATLGYDVEMSATTIDEVKGDDATVTAKMRALSGSKFVGYVNDNGTVGKTATAVTKYTPSSVTVGNVKFEANINEDLDGIKFVTAAGAAAVPAVADKYVITFTGTATAADDGSTNQYAGGVKLNLGAGDDADAVATAFAGAYTAAGYTVTDTHTTTAGTVTITATTTGAVSEALALSAGGPVNGVSWTVARTAGADEVPVPGSTITITPADTELGTPEVITYTFKNGLAAANVAADYAVAALAAGGNALLFNASATAAPTADAGGTSGGYAPGADSDSPIKASYASAIQGNVSYVVKFGSMYSATNDTTLELYNQATTFTQTKKDDAAALTEKSAFTLDPVSEATTKILVPSETKLDGDFAKVGTYTIYFLYHDGDKHSVAKKKWGEATATLKVTNSIAAPRVTVTSRKIVSDDLDSFKDVIKVNTDLNNKDGQAESLIGVLNKDMAAATVNDKDQVAVKYVVVEENIFGAANDVNFILNLGNTFTVE